MRGLPAAAGFAPRTRENWLRKMRGACSAGLLETVHKQSGVKRSYLFLSAVLMLLGFIFFGFGASFLINIIGFTWPAYHTFKAIENEEDRSEDRFW